MTGMELLLCFSVATSTLCVIGMLSIYKSMERSMDVLVKTIHSLITQKIKNGDAVVLQEKSG